MSSVLARIPNLGLAVGGIALAWTTAAVVAQDSRPETTRPPFPAAKIRAATLPGRTIVFRQKQGGQVGHLQMSFSEPDEEGVVVTNTALDEELKPLEGRPARTQRSTWKELEGHAHFPKANTEKSEETIKVPAGEFACWKFVVSQGELKRTLWFAKELPGPPVKMLQEKDGETLFSLILVRHTPGKKPAPAKQPAKQQNGAGKPPASKPTSKPAPEPPEQPEPAQEEKKPRRIS